MSDYESMQPEAPEWAIDEMYTLKERAEKAEKERDEMKELLAECAYSKHTQEAMSKDLFDRILKVLKKEAGR